MDRRVAGGGARSWASPSSWTASPSSSPAASASAWPLGRAIVRKPAVFLFDEPLSNLDAKLRVQMRAEISQAPEDACRPPPSTSPTTRSRR